MSILCRRQQYGLNAKCRVFLSDFNEIWAFLRQIFLEVPNYIKFHVNPCGVRRGRTDGHDEANRSFFFATVRTRLTREYPVQLPVCPPQIPYTRFSGGADAGSVVVVSQ